jgi:hypothetical protein
MAATTHTHWLYPPEYQSGDFPKDTGKTIGPHRWAIRLLGEATGTEDETNVLKVDLSDLVTPDGIEPTKFVIENVEYEMRGFTGVHLLFERTPSNHRFFSSGGANSGKQDFTRLGGLVDQNTGGTGDILLTTVGGSAYDVYAFTITFRVK